MTLEPFGRKKRRSSKSQNLVYHKIQYFSEELEMAKKKILKERGKIKIRGKVYRKITPAEMAEIAEDLGADVITEREDIIKLARKINRRHRHPK